MTLTVWTDAQFGGLSWHDNHVHGIRLVEGEHGSGELILDLDHILEWLHDADGYRFRIVPAMLRFIGVTNLRVALDYATPSAALGPFSIHAIERRTVQRERYAAQVWTIVLNWPEGEITFEATGFEQKAWGKPVVSTEQRLLAIQRCDA